MIKQNNYPPPCAVVELVLVLKMVLKTPAEMKQKTRGTRIVKPIHPGDRERTRVVIRFYKAYQTYNGRWKSDCSHISKWNYANTPTDVMGIERSKITCRTQVYKFHAHSLKDIFLVHFWDFSLFLKDLLITTMFWVIKWAQNLSTCVVHLILDCWTTMAILGALV